MAIRRDSLLHAETCALIAVVAGLFLPWWGAGLVALTAGIGKEIWDRYHGGVPSWADLGWDAVGAAIGALIALI
jgi:hypothetical protein